MSSPILGLALAACLLGGGCGGEPTGDDAYSQKFDAPPDAPKATGPMPDAAEERRAEIKKSQEIDAKKAAAKKK